MARTSLTRPGHDGLGEASPTSARRLRQKTRSVYLLLGNTRYGCPIINRSGEKIMHPYLRMLLLPALALPALSVAAMADEPATTEVAPAHHTRMTREQHFAKANTAGDGHLTMEEAKSGFPLVAKHFADMDVDGKGYVTIKDLQTWYAMRKVARSLRNPPDDTPQLRNARQPGLPGERPIGTPVVKQMTVSAGQ
jgi:hypothetical protein